MENIKEVAPAKIIRDRYIPIEDVEDICGITVEECKEMIKRRDIKYAEFTKPGEHKRSPHVDPEEIRDFLLKKNYTRI